MPSGTRRGWLFGSILADIGGGIFGSGGFLGLSSKTVIRNSGVVDMRPLLWLLMLM
jgi:hypothetical protein